MAELEEEEEAGCYTAKKKGNIWQREEQTEADEEEKQNRGWCPCTGKKKKTNAANIARHYNNHREPSSASSQSPLAAP